MNQLIKTKSFSNTRNMLKEDILKMIDNHPIFHLATCEDNVPHVRHMFLYRANTDGILFHTSFYKDVCQQILENNNVELCFFDLKSFLQIRVSGKAIVVADQALKEEILSHPTRDHLRRLKSMTTDEEFYENFTVFQLIQAKAHLWSIQGNYNEMKNYEKKWIILD